MDYKSKFEEACRYVKRLTEEFNRLNIENCRLKDEKRALELRSKGNPYHDERGRFASGDITKRFSNGGAKPKNPENKLTGGQNNAIIFERVKIFENELKGTKTVTGTIISRVSFHAAERMIQRNVSSSTAKDTLTTAKISYPGNKPYTHCVQKNNLRLVYSENGTLISSIVLSED